MQWRGKAVGHRFAHPNLWACTMLSAPCVTSACLGCAAIHARISLEKVLCSPVFRPLFPFAVSAKRSGLTQACGHSSQVDHL